MFGKPGEHLGPGLFDELEVERARCRQGGQTFALFCRQQPGEFLVRCGDDCRPFTGRRLTELGGTRREELGDLGALRVRQLDVFRDGWL